MLVKYIKKENVPKVRLNKFENGEAYEAFYDVFRNSCEFYDSDGMFVRKITDRDFRNFFKMT